MSYCVKTVKQEDVCPLIKKALGEVAVQRAIVTKSKLWDPNQEITYHFIGGNNSQRNHVRAGFAKVLKEAKGVKLKEVSTGAQIRISFVSNAGSWSYVGTDALLIDRNKATMNFGWQEDTHRVVVHELLHALGFYHEHTHPDIVYNWNKLYTDYARETGWSKEQIDINFKPNDDANVLNYDENSILHYWVDCKYVISGPCGKLNTKLSKGDIETLNKLFPYTPPVNPKEPEEPKEPTNKGCLPFLSILFQSKKKLYRMDKTQLKHIADELGIEYTSIHRNWDLINLIHKTLSLYRIKV